MKGEANPAGSASFLLHPSFFRRAGFPLASMASHPATETQGPTAQCKKLAAGRGINTIPALLQARARKFFACDNLSCRTLSPPWTIWPPRVS